MDMWTIGFADRLRFPRFPSKLGRRGNARLRPHTHRTWSHRSRSFGGQGVRREVGSEGYAEKYRAVVNGGFPLGRSGSAGPLLGRASLLRHSGLLQTGEISGLAKSTDCLSLITGRGSQTSDARIRTLATQPTSFGEFRGGAFGLVCDRRD
jgi:hypothetical protein